MKPLEHLTEEEFAQLVRDAVALPDAPPALVRAAIDQWPARRPAALETAVQAVIRRVAAVLTFDSWAVAPLAMGMRAVPSETRHLLYSAMGHDIDLRITPAIDRFALSGQILGSDDSGFVELAAQPEEGVEPPESRTVPLDFLGEFRLDGVRRGTYRLKLRLGDNEIVLPPVNVDQRAS